MLQTERLILRAWEDGDAESLFAYAKDPAVGTPAGWPPHRSLSDSREILHRILMQPETYAICLRSDNAAIGSISLMQNSDLASGTDERELGYWIGKPFWGRGLVPEAAQKVLRHAFEDLGLKRVWAGFYDGNERSRRVQEKCGFRYQWTTEGLFVPQMNDTRTGHVMLLTREDWEKDCTLPQQNG